MNYLEECQNNKDFWRAFPEFGGALTYESIDEKSREYYESPLLTVKSLLDNLKILDQYNEIDSRISLGYLCSNSNNAVVKKTENQYFVGVNSGLVDTIITAVNSIFSSPNTFINYGNPYRETNRHLFGSMDKVIETNPENHIKSGFKTKIIPFANNYHNYQVATWTTPIDRDRRAIAQLVILYAIEFVFIHELSHIFCGHIDFINDNSLNYSFISNAYNSNNDETKIKISHWMESDADVMAFQIIHSSGIFLPEKDGLNLYYSDLIRESILDNDEFKYTYIKAENPNIVNEWTGMPLKYEHLEKDLEFSDLSFFWYLAIQVVQYLFIQDEKTINNWNIRSHPHPMIRIFGLSPEYTLDTTKDVVIEMHLKPWLNALNHLSSLWNIYLIPGIASVIDMDNIEYVASEFIRYNREVLSDHSLIYNHLKENKYRVVGESIYKYLRNRK